MTEFIIRYAMHDFLGVLWIPLKCFFNQMKFLLVHFFFQEHFFLRNFFMDLTFSCLVKQSEHSKPSTVRFNFNRNLHLVSNLRLPIKLHAIVAEWKTWKYASPSLLFFTITSLFWKIEYNKVIKKYRVTNKKALPKEQTSGI